MPLICSGDVTRRADDAARLGQLAGDAHRLPRPSRGGRARKAGRRGRLDQAEVEQLGDVEESAALADQDVSGFDVAMDEAD